MGARAHRRTAVEIVSALALLTSGAEAIELLSSPGPHFIDRVGIRRTERFALPVTAAVDLTLDGVPDGTIEFTGTVEVHHSAASVSDPTGDPGHRNHLDLEIVSMALVAALPPFGEVALHGGDGIGNFASDGPLYSPGTSDEIPGTTDRAQDYFDLYFEANLLGMVLHNLEAIRVSAVIDRVPPIGSRFTFTGPPVAFVDAEGTPVFQLTQATATPLRADDFRCYAIAPQNRPGAHRERLGLSDARGMTTSRVLRRKLLCVPASLDGAPTLNPDDSLVCYGIADAPRSRPLPLRLSDQLGALAIESGAARLLCVPGTLSVE